MSPAGGALLRLIGHPTLSQHTRPPSGCVYSGRGSCCDWSLQYKSAGCRLRLESAGGALSIAGPALITDTGGFFVCFFVFFSSLIGRCRSHLVWSAMGNNYWRRPDTIAHMKGFLNATPARRLRHLANNSFGPHKQLLYIYIYI